MDVSELKQLSNAFAIKLKSFLVAVKFRGSAQWEYDCCILDKAGEHMPSEVVMFTFSDGDETFIFKANMNLVKNNEQVEISRFMEIVNG